MEWNTQNNEIHIAFTVLEENWPSVPYIPMFLWMVAISISEIIKINFNPERTDKRSEISHQKGCHGGHLYLIFDGRKK